MKGTKLHSCRPNHNLCLLTSRTHKNSWNTTNCGREIMNSSNSAINTFYHQYYNVLKPFSLVDGKLSPMTLAPNKDGSNSLQNFGTYVSYYTASHPKRQLYWYAQTWEFQILHGYCISNLQFLGARTSVGCPSGCFWWRVPPCGVKAADMLPPATTKQFLKVFTSTNDTYIRH